MEEHKKQQQLKLEKYLQSNQVYATFKYFLRQLIMEQPEDPVQYILDLISNPEIQIISIVSSSDSRPIAEHLAALKDIPVIDVRRLIHDQANNTTSLQHRVMKEAVENQQLAGEEFVIPMVLNEINIIKEKAGYKGFILNSFPVTRLQGIALQSRGIFPNKVIVYEPQEQVIVDWITAQLKKKTNVTQATQSELALIYQQARNLAKEKQYHIEQVKKLYGKIHHIITTPEIPKELYLPSLQGPRSPPVVIVLGPPGSGVTTQVIKIAKKLNLVPIFTKSLVGKDMNNDEKVIQKVENRLQRSDVKVSGAIMESFPLNPNQLRQFQTLPSLIVILQLDNETIYERLEQRILDPVTCTFYKGDVEDPLVKERLVSIRSHNEINEQIQSWETLRPCIKEKYGESTCMELRGDMEENLLTEHVVNALYTHFK